MYKAKFQSFEDRAERAASLPRVAALRTEVARRGLTGWVVPRADRHENEYVPDSDERLAWLTGFTGSAGEPVVLMRCAKKPCLVSQNLHIAAYNKQAFATA